MGNNIYFLSTKCWTWTSRAAPLTKKTSRCIERGAQHHSEHKFCSSLPEPHSTPPSHYTHTQHTPLPPEIGSHPPPHTKPTQFHYCQPTALTTCSWPAHTDPKWHPHRTHQNSQITPHWLITSHTLHNSLVLAHCSPPAMHPHTQITHQPSLGRTNAGNSQWATIFTF